MRPFINCLAPLDDMLTLTNESFYKTLKLPKHWAKIVIASSPKGFLSRMIVLTIQKLLIYEDEILTIMFESMNSQMHLIAFRLKSDPGTLIYLIAQLVDLPCSTSSINYWLVYF